MTTGSEAVHYEVRNERIGVITLDRPPVNAYDDQMMAELHEAWRRAAGERQVRVIVLRANGPHFCAGGQLGDTEATTGHAGAPPASDWSMQRDIPKPTIAAVQGGCIAGGQRFVWPCDLIIAADDAFFVDPLLKFGVPGIPAQGHTWEYGSRLAKLMLSTAARVSAQQAKRRGMVNRVVPRAELEDHVLALAADIADQDPFALAQAKRAVNRAVDMKGNRYLANRFAELMDGFDMAQLHQSGPATSSRRNGTTGA